MHHTAAVFASVTSLGLICMIYYCNILSPKGSWLRNDVIATILLSLLTGLFPLAVVASLFGLWKVAAGGLSPTAILAAGADMLAIGAIVTAYCVSRALVKATYRTRTGLGPVLSAAHYPSDTSNTPLSRTAA
jgi:hypothetical protein